MAKKMSALIEIDETAYLVHYNYEAEELPSEESPGEPEEIEIEYITVADTTVNITAAIFEPAEAVGALDDIEEWWREAIRQERAGWLDGQGGDYA